MQGEEDMYSVVFRNIDVISTRDGIDFKHNWGQGEWSDILVENITVDEIIMENDKYGNPINFQVQRGGSIKDVTIKNVIIQDPGTPGGIYGHHVEENHPGYISHIYFENVEVGGIPWVDLESSRLTLDAYANANTIYFNGIPVSPVQVHTSDPIHTSALAQNFPNPFNLSTVIKYQLAVDSMVQLAIYDLLGREIKTLVQQYQNSGEHSISFDASELASGIYIYKLKAGPIEQSRKMWVKHL
ncbi:MAG: T9SS type A sorting domain-containing protein [Bacteroidetes bacterium]|nr:T9SS type A sorting domain-containing protein [Bacteroidota bacterium]